MGACDPANITQQVLNRINASATTGPTGPTGPAGTSMGSNGTFVVGSNSTVNANNGSTVYVNDGAQLVDNRTNNTFSLLGFRCSGVFLGNNATVDLSIGRNNPNSSPYTVLARAQDVCVNTTLLGGGCDLRCDNDTDYRMLFVTRNMVVPGNVPYNDTSGSGSFVECGASYFSRDPTLAKCVLHATSYCCNTTLNSTSTTPTG